MLHAADLREGAQPGVLLIGRTTATPSAPRQDGTKPGRIQPHPAARRLVGENHRETEQPRMTGHFKRTPEPWLGARAICGDQLLPNASLDHPVLPIPDLEPCCSGQDYS
jgi:hypothetical protein